MGGERAGRDEVQEVPLEGVRGEFREALREEIEAATRAASAAGVALINGRRIGKSAEAYQYAFSVENALSVPDDVPGDLYVPSLGKRVDAVVISVQGLAVTVSVNLDLGEFVAQAKLTSNLAHLMRKLIQRIEDAREEPNPGGDRLLGQAVRGGTPSPRIGVDTGRLNQRQLEAVAASIGRDTTFIWGPPGTGKTTVIGAIGEALYRQDRSLLLVSHTNAAVDQALMKIAAALGPELREGSVLRVGEPKDLQLAERDDLLLKPQVERRSRELVERRDELEVEQRQLIAGVRELTRLVDIIEWLPEAVSALEHWRDELAALQLVDERTRAAQQVTRRLHAQEPEQRRLHDAAGEARAAELDTEQAQRDLPGAEETLRSVARHDDEGRLALRAAEGELTTARRLEPVRRRAAELPAHDAAREHLSDSERNSDAAETVMRDATVVLDAERDLLRQTQEASGLTRRFRGLPKPDEQAEVVARAETQHLAAEERARRARTIAEDAASVYAETERLVAQLAPHAGVPSVADGERALAEATAAAEVARKVHGEATERATALRRAIAEGTVVLAAFRREHGDPSDVIRAFEQFKVRLASATDEFMALARQAAGARAVLTEALTAPTLAVVEWGLSSQPTEPTAEARLAMIEQAVISGEAVAAAHDVRQLRAELVPLKARLAKINEELATIADALQRIEETVIAEATIIATTLTRAYLRDSIYGRRFDTVVLDEASMAPIPALWVAASLADKGVVVVGDPKQLPPIALAAEEDEPDKAATRWLGRDIFEAGDVLGEDDAQPACVVQLDTQFRMHPQISAIVNELAYRGRLKDGRDTSADGGLDGWYRWNWGHDAPVLMVDTGDVDAWCSTIDAGGRTSRINFLSATIAADLAGRLLADDRPEHVAGATPRIIIATPYRPQARLLQLLIRERGLQGEVVAGTAHTFQGSEAPVVIFDTVVDEPHWKVNLFIPALDESNRRLLNVAISRAQQRLIVLGDIEYVRKTGKKAVLGRLVERLLDQGTPRVTATDTVAAGLSARTAQSSSVVFGAVSAADADTVVMTQDEYFRHLNADLDAAADRCVLYSPFVTRNGLARAEPHLRAAVERGVSVYVVTKAHDDRAKRELPEIRQLEKALTRWGVIVIHKRRMHEKVVLIDGDVVWSGSLNTLSFSDTQEVMMRFVSQPLHDDLCRALRLDDVISVYAPDGEDSGRASCPICESPLDAAEGGRGPYLTCPNTECSYTRSVDAPAPRNGMIVCSNCGERVEYHATEKRGSFWRCKANSRHWQRIARTHLKLPRMHRLMTRAQLRRVCAELNLDISEVRRATSQPTSRPSNEVTGQDDELPESTLF